MNEIEFPAAGTSQPAVQARLRKLLPIHEESWFHVFLVPEPDNKYDPRAVLITIPTMIGRESLGYVPARRYCPHCDPGRAGRGHRAYTDEHGDEVTYCPNHETAVELRKSDAELLSTVLKDERLDIEVRAKIVGANKDTLGLRLVARILEQS